MTLREGVKKLFPDDSKVALYEDWDFLSIDSFKEIIDNPNSWICEVHNCSGEVKHSVLIYSYKRKPKFNVATHITHSSLICEHHWKCLSSHKMHLAIFKGKYYLQEKA